MTEEDVAYRAAWLAKVKGRVQIDANDCWIWQGPLATNGYGQVTYKGRTRILSRCMYQVWHGVKLARLQYVCHSCDVKRCCNPAHLWVGNNGLNKKDETAKGKNYWANRTHCPRGHEYTQENTYVHEVRPGVFSRNCKACEVVRGRLKAGWTLEDAMKLPKVPSGYTREYVK